ncbi:hypothetical protein OSTOST_14862, partial [Ostertagia ostertagi]
REQRTTPPPPRRSSSTEQTPQRPPQDRPSSTRPTPTPDRPPSRGTSGARTPTPMRRCQCPYHSSSTQKKSPSYDVASVYVNPELRNEGEPPESAAAPPHSRKHRGRHGGHHRDHRKNRRTSSSVSDDTRTPKEDSRKDDLTKGTSGNHERRKSDWMKGTSENRLHEGSNKKTTTQFRNRHQAGQHIFLYLMERLPTKCSRSGLGSRARNGKYHPYDLNLPATLPKHLWTDYKL